MMGIVVIGSVFVDIKGYPFSQYIPGGRNAGRVEYVHGGVSRNIAEDIGNLELRPTFVSLVDETGIGQDVLVRLRKHKVNTDYIRIVPEGMGTWLAVFDNNNDVCASISRRPDLAPILNILEASGDEIFAGADSILLEIDMEADLIKEIFRLAEKYGKRVYAAVSNINIAMERRDLLQRTACVVCNLQEADMLFSEDYERLDADGLRQILTERLQLAGIQRMVVTLGEQGAVYADADGDSGFCPAQRVEVLDTTGAGDAFFAGVAIGLTYGKSLAASCEIGTRLASSVIATKESVCPRFRPEEFGLPEVAE